MLTDSKIRQSKPREKPYKLADGGGMYLEVMPNWSKYWRLKYRYGGKEKRLALGVYPGVSLKKAREKRSDARELLDDGIDPGEASTRSCNFAVESLCRKKIIDVSGF